MKRGRRRSRPAMEECPHCGELVRTGRPSCPHCGSDAETGWASPEEIAYQSVELMESDDPADRSLVARWPRVAAALGFLLAFLALVLFLFW